MDSIVSVKDVYKSYGDVHALEGVSLEIEKGTILGLLGPNGAGKTTLVNILATLLKADKGSAVISGIDVARDPSAIRSRIGLTGQFAAVDEILTGRENLHLVGTLYHLPPEVVKERTEQLLEQFSLVDAADRQVKTYSGGMRRRLDVASSLLSQPEVLFLDEPTTGLDPHSRIELWEAIEQLVKDGTTVLLTTQYLEEADRLADNIVIIDKGKVVAEGTSQQLKARVGEGVLEVQTLNANALPVIQSALIEFSPTVHFETKTVSIAVQENTKILLDVIKKIDGAGVEVVNIELRKPTLDEVFLSLTQRA